MQIAKRVGASPPHPFERGLLQQSRIAVSSLLLILGVGSLEGRTVQGQEYILDGGGNVIVHKPFGAEYYSAVVAMEGEYPGPGKIAHDAGRSEFIYVLDGAFAIRINEGVYHVKAGENVLIQDGDSYSISGQGRCLVLVHDQEGGKTEILNQ